MDFSALYTHQLSGHSPMQLYVSFTILALTTLAITRFMREHRRNPLRLPSPPGPRGYPAIGNLFDFPISHPWLTYARWAKVYGDIFSLEVLGRKIIVLSSLEAVQDLFERRSANYSDRPRMPMLIELMNFGFVFAVTPYGSWWRKQRRSFEEHFRASAVHKYQPIQSREARILLRKMLESPQNLFSHIRENQGSIIMSATYGIKTKGFGDPYIQNVEESLRGFNAAGIPGAFMVDLMPILKYVPSWFPGAGFKNMAAHWAQVNHDVVELPFRHVVQQMKEGTAGPSIAADLISVLAAVDKEQLEAETTCAKNVTATAYLAGADTTISGLQILMLALTLYPEVQKKAQTELDSVVGPNRLPEFTDRPFLPYINAIIKETLRWQLVVPLAFPHVATQDDVYRGYFIPKGTLVFGNSWSILHDEGVFKDPNLFNPDRYMKDGQLDPTVRQPDVGAFGYGRRICPGRYLADNTMFIIAASILHSFNVTPARDVSGNQISVLPQMTPGLLSYPEPFSIDVKPRNALAVDRINAATLEDN